ncbi:MAG: right-handed parallel beta-helix repeat-containing protein [Clostridiales Family XIII bacterium]|nr:right-handed parallel beta-helix repeat-containing protein [Clostridiales Family XIII bacterium]
MRKEFHVAKHGSDNAIGSQDAPYLTIDKAAHIAAAGDTVIVHEGVYREWVRPQNTGLSNTRRVVFKAADGEKVTIKGSEEITGWEKVNDRVWKKILPNSFFGEFNPFATTIVGEWVVHGLEKHLGDVYLNGLSFYEVTAYEDLENPQIRTEVYDDGSKLMTPVINPEQTKYVWYAEVKPGVDGNTAIFANFHEYDPNQELVEISVRKTVFYPEITGIDYVTVSGFELAHAASPWAPPTADQPGLIGPNWSKGWIIENNIIHDAKASAISIGKEITTGHNQYTRRGDKAGYNYQLEAVFTALTQRGWNKEHVGSHIIRNNTIYDCGQNGIVGHLGCVFSEIYDNNIYNIGIKREYFGYEIAGIKLHAALDVLVRHNRIHNCVLGSWFDWQAQGTRVTQNVYYNNNRDFFVEVSHGPFLADNNIFASPDFFLDASQGLAFVNNLINGDISSFNVLDRPTPYHFPHSTQVKGFSVAFRGDERWYNNIFNGTSAAWNQGEPGTARYNGQATTLEEYLQRVKDQGPGDFEAFLEVNYEQVSINNNAYFGGAKAFDREENNIVDDTFDPKFSIIEEGDELFVSITLPESIYSLKTDAIDTEILDRVRIVDANFENADGSALTIDTDILGQKYEAGSIIGPITKLKPGVNKIRLW